MRTHLSQAIVKGLLYMDKDPCNVIVAGVGGQGNVAGTQLMGVALVDQGYKVTIGDIYGASQRGGSVMSHMRISMAHEYGPVIPERCAHILIALELIEAVRVLARYGNGRTLALVNTRLTCSPDPISGNRESIDRKALISKIKALSGKSYFLDATEKALELGNPILANTIMIGAVSKSGLLPISDQHLEKVIREYIFPDKVEVNLKAYALGKSLLNLVTNAQDTE